MRNSKKMVRVVSIILAVLLLLSIGSVVLSAVIR